MAEDQSLPTVDVTAETVREDLKPDSFANPYRTPLSNRLGTENFTADDIKKMQPKDVFDLLDKATGISVTYQGRKNPFFVKERGGGTFTYIIDGAVIPTVTQRILQRIPLAAIEEFKIVRDSTALTLGPLVGIGASGGGDGLTTGYIIIRTKQPQGNDLSLAVADEKSPDQPNSHKESLFAGRRIGSPAGKDGMNGYIAGFLSDFSRPSLDTWFDGQSGHAQMAKAGFGNEKASLNLSSFEEKGRFEMQRGIAPGTNVLDSSMWYYDPAKTTVKTATSTINWNPDQVTLASAFGTRFTQIETDASFASATKSVSSYDEGTSGYSLRHKARFGSTNVNLGTQSTHSWATGSSGPTPNTRWGSTVRGYAATVEQALLEDRLSLDAGYRRDSKHVDTTDTTVRMNNIDMPPATALSLGGRWAATSVYAVNARYFDGKQGSASSNFSMLPTPGTALDPEKQRRKELAIEGKFSPTFSGTLTWFDVYIQNQKSQTSTAYTYNSAQYYYYTQSNNQRSGNELLIRGSLAPRTTYKASWTHMYRNISSNASVSKTNPNNLYDLSISHGWDVYTADFSIKRVDSFMGSNAAGPTGTGTAVNTMIGGYTRIDANLIRDFNWVGAAWSTTLYGRNLTNKHYYTQQGPTGLYPDRGRVLGIELRMDY
jgi:iron complex outermembrane receptor protein